MNRKTGILILFLSVWTGAFAQDFDSRPAVNIENKKEDLQFTIGARFMADAAYYGHGGEHQINSGAAITDARIRTSMTYRNWYFYADFDFSRGKFSQKNIFLQYAFSRTRGRHLVKAGYFNNPATMANNTSRGSLHFISLAAPVNALAPGRELGVNYIFHNRAFLASQGVFAENKYNDQVSGFQGVAVGGRWIWRPFNREGSVLHVGIAGRYAEIGTGSKIDNVVRTGLNLSTSLETYTDPTKAFLSVEMPWARHDYYLSGELLLIQKRLFARGEYMYRHIAKRRDDAALFAAQLAKPDAYPTIDAWKAANPLSSDTFHGAYFEAGYRILGGNYAYSDADGVVKGASKQALEVVARYSFLDLDYVLPAGPVSSETSRQGDVLHSATAGINYAFNKYAKVLLSYSYCHLRQDNVNVVQCRLMFQF